LKTKHAVVDNRLELLECIFRMSKVITPHFEELIDRFVATGRFNNKSEVIRAGLRLLEEHEAKASPGSREDLSRIIETALLDPRPLIPAAKLLRRRRRK
jgi:antitoxin ParD1/3/4